MSKVRKAKQLGMNPSTASNRLVKDLLWSMIQHQPCHRCGELMARETYSIEHKEAWLDSANPVEMYFDIDNIAYSHFKCNVAARRTVSSIYSKEQLRAIDAERKREMYTPEERREKYLRTGH